MSAEYEAAQEICGWLIEMNKTLEQMQSDSNTMAECASDIRRQFAVAIVGGMFDAVTTPTLERLALDDEALRRLCKHVWYVAGELSAAEPHHEHERRKLKE